MAFAELMVLGFISLILTFGQNYIIQICIPEKVADTMLPCRKEEKPEIGGGEGKGEHAGGGGNGGYDGGEAHHRRLLWDALTVIYSNRRLLAEPSVPNCPKVKINIYGFFIAFD